MLRDKTGCGPGCGPTCGHSRAWGSDISHLFLYYKKNSQEIIILLSLLGILMLPKIVDSGEIVMTIVSKCQSYFLIKEESST
jgi:hypothetical protein